MIYHNILEALGNTPLIRLNRMTEPDAAQILVKYEGLNVGGSIKTRTALRMIEEAEAAGKLNSESIIVEPTSGNQGIGLALVAAVKGYKAKLVIPDSVSEERRKIMQQYGAEVVLVPDNGNIGECIEQCVATVERLRAENEHVFVPQQFQNEGNLRAHRFGTAAELLADVQEAGITVDGFCAGIGTGGTITGIGQELRKAFPEICIWAVEPENAAILSGGAIGSHVQMGIGDGLIPDILDTHIYDATCIITDEEALATSRELAAKEGLLCGISSGTNVAAARRLARELGAGKTVVTLLPDTGERYFSTPLFND